MTSLSKKWNGKMSKGPSSRAVNLRLRTLVRRHGWHQVDIERVFLNSDGTTRAGWSNQFINPRWRSYDAQRVGQIELKEMREWCESVFDRDNYTFSLISHGATRFAFKREEDLVLFTLKWKE